MRWTALVAAGAVLTATAVLGLPSRLAAATADGVVLTHGPLALGVNAYGDLNYDCNPDADACRGPFYTGLRGDVNTNVVGLRRYTGEVDLDGIAPGGPAEGWGIADVGSQLSGWANEDDGGPSGLVLDSFTTTDSTATSVTSAGSSEGTPRLQVTQTYEPSADANLFQATVTVTNTGAATATDVRYRRVVDWDIAPTAFDEYVTLQGTPPELIFDSDGGFASADPLSTDERYIDTTAPGVCGEDYEGTCEFTDLGRGGSYPEAGPDDHGALFDFALGGLDVGQSRTFKLYYGVALSENDALTSLSAVGAQTYSLGQSACVGDTVETCGFVDDGGGLGDGGGTPPPLDPGGPRIAAADVEGDAGPTRGTPATFMLGFAFDRPADVSLAKTASRSAATAGDTISYTLTSRNNTRANPATGVTVVDPLPAGTTLVSASPGCSGTATVTCTVGTLAPLTSATSTITVRATTAGTKTNTATVSSTSTDPVLGNNTATATTVVTKPDVVVTPPTTSPAPTKPASPKPPTTTPPTTQPPTDTPATPSPTTPATDEPTPDIPLPDGTEPTSAPTTEPSSTPTPSATLPAPVVGLRLSTPSVNPGGRLTAAGSGCRPSETVQLSVDGRAAGTGAAGSDGTFDVPVTAPDLPVGNHTVTAQCGRVRQVAPVSFVFVTSESSAPGAKALTVGAMLAFFLLLLSLTLRRPGR